MRGFSVLLLVAAFAVAVQGNPFQYMMKTLYNLAKDKYEMDFKAKNPGMEVPTYEPYVTAEPEMAMKGNPWKKLSMHADKQYAEAEEAKGEPKSDSESNTKSEPEPEAEAEFKHIAWFFTSIVFIVIAVTLAIVLTVVCTRAKQAEKF